MTNKEYPDLEALCLAEVTADNELKLKQQERDAIRMAILKHPDVQAQREGSLSERHGRFKITTTARMNRKVDIKEYEKIKDQIPEGLSPFVYTLTIDKQRLKALEQANPELHLHCCRAIEETPGKVGVSIKEESN